MEPPNAFPQLQLWCPRPFGTFSQNKPCPSPAACHRRCHPRCPPGAPRAAAPPRTRPRSPPEPGPAGAAGAATTEDGRVLLDTWYVIKPGNTKEKVAFFVAHQCGGAARHRRHAGRASTMKVKGNWGSDSSKAKRRRRCHHEPKRPGDSADLLSVAEIVALVERRAALALQSLPRSSACDAPAPLVLLEAPGGPECRRVAAAVAQFESQKSQKPAPRGALAAPPDPTACAGAAPEAAAAAPGRTGGRRRRHGCQRAARRGRASAERQKDQITCDLYRLVSPARLLLAAKGDKDGADEAAAAEQSGRRRRRRGVRRRPRDRASGFHVDVVVTGVVDQCVFFGKDSAKQVTEETVRLPEEPPPPGQLFLLPEEPATAAAAASSSSPGKDGGAGDPALCRLYRHVSHDFLEIRFKIQRLLEPRQYMLLLPEHVMVKIFSYLPTQALAALKCSCHYFKSIIETFGVRAADSRWNRDPLYRDDPCKQCKKRYERGDVSLCRWHPKPYHHDLPYGRSYWMCCRRTDREAPGCRTGLHDNNWVHPAGGWRRRRRRAQGRGQVRAARTTDGRTRRTRTRGRLAGRQKRRRGNCDSASKTAENNFSQPAAANTKNSGCPRRATCLPCTDVDAQQG
ncbi:LOW QUALITY PROTEIN: F-box only protein 46 [Melospiza melodia melodia]|uniref:LOW QUALITY PROTEIN: F-box only protein 46 n=1 Tax=Melospiza melodia melodia TaxID=1914991 RepID=UPI002FD6FC89